MSIFIVILLAMALTLVLMRCKLPIGICIFGGGLFIWVCTNPDWRLITKAVEQMVTMSRTYDFVIALYLVICLEIELRKSGALAGMVQCLSRMFSSAKFTLAVMPAFLGVLPSIGGARFSAPIVQEAAKGMDVTAEDKAAINFWFRHIFEFSSPIIPGMILACGIAGVKIGDLIVHLGWMTIMAFILGWIVMVRPIKGAVNEVKEVTPEEKRREIIDFFVALGPVIANVVLMVAFELAASISMAIVVCSMVPVLYALNRPVSVKDIFVGALDWKLFANVGCILLFIQLLDTTGVLAQIVAAFKGSSLPIPVIIAIVSFIIGILTGLSQGHVAIVMPIVAALSMGDLDLVGVAMVFGVAGQMITPTHVCLTITVDYFKSDFFKTLIPVLIAQGALLVIFSVVSYFTWG
jgi:integral membrane protein (TIGR00529 family)